MSNRYHRQQQVPQFGSESAQKLSAAQVLIVGAGGLGSPLAVQLAGAGVGHITIIDHDRVSLSNLHRQSLYTENDIDEFKSVAAKKRLAQVNSEITIQAINEPLNPSNVEQLVAKHSVVVDAADSFFVSYLLSDTCFESRTPLVSASVLQTSGYVGVFCGTQSNPAPSMRAIFPSPPLTANNCNTAGVTGPSVGIMGSVQAQEVLKVILHDDSQLLGKLLYLDLWDYRQNIVNFSSAPEPKYHAKLISEDTLMLGETKRAVLDVRSELEVTQQPKPYEVVHIPVADLSQRHSELNANQRIVCVCKSGQRALNAAHQLVELGYTNLAVAL